MKENVVFEKSKDFAIRIVNLYNYLCDNKKEYVLSKQILRSGTSIGANIAESECAISRKDFLSKLYIALKESSETLYWLDLLFETNYIDEKMYHSFNSDWKKSRRCSSHQLKRSVKLCEDDQTGYAITPHSTFHTPN